MSPMVDVRVALTNPYTLDRFGVIRRQQTVSQEGIVQVLQPQLFANVRGVVAPGIGQKDLMRMNDAQLQSKGILIITKFALRGVSEGPTDDYQPDIIVWNGDNYIVVFPDDFSNYAQGFIRAVCVMIDISQQPAEVGKAVDQLGGQPSPALLAEGGRIAHPPREVPDGVNATFTFTGLPQDPTQYDIVWNDLVQGGYTQNGEQITLGATPQGTTPVPNVGDKFYAVW